MSWLPNSSGFLIREAMIGRIGQAGEWNEWPHGKIPVLTWNEIIRTMPRIVQIQFSTESAARSALRLQSAFLANNIESSIISLRSGMHDGDRMVSLGKKAQFLSRLDERIRNAFVRYKRKEFGLFSYPVLGTDISGIKQVREADIIYVHWALGGFLNFSVFRKLASLRKPIVIVMHDMWTFTGGCHYSFSCKKFRDNCNNCQMLEKTVAGDFAKKGFRKKEGLYGAFNNFYFVSPSKWLYNCARESYLLRDKPVFYIPNVLDSTVFKPFDKSIAKRLLNLDNNRPVIAFGAVSVDNPYKGWNYLVDSLSVLHNDPAYRDLQVLVFGRGNQNDISRRIPYAIKFTGFLNDEYSAMLVYNAADVFIVPSVADNQPTTVQESLSCGTPVVGFDVGGIPDMVNHLENGYIAKYRDSEDICYGIKYCLANRLKGSRLSVFDTEVTMLRHLDLFNFIKQSGN